MAEATKSIVEPSEPTNQPAGASIMNDSKPRFWTTLNGWAGVALIAGAGYLLLAEHQAHVIAALPWLILLACPLMHVLMHRGHGHGGRDRDRDSDGHGKHD